MAFMALCRGTSCGLAVVLASAGCAQILGIDETSGGGSTRTLEIVGIFDGGSLVMQPLDLSAETASWFVRDAGDPMTLDTFSGTPSTSFSGWSAAVTGSAPMIELTLPDVPTPYTHFIELPDSDDHAIVGEFYYGHPSPQDPPPDATFDVTITPPSAVAVGESFEIYAIGAWTEYTLTATDAPVTATTIGPLTLPYSNFTAVTPAPSVQIDSSDVVVVLRYLGGVITGLLTVPSFEQSDAAQPITGAMTAVTADQTFTATIDASADEARFDALRPAMTDFMPSWSVNAAPGAMATSGAGPLLASGTLTMADTSFTSTYANPFTAQGWPTLVAYEAVEYRQYTAGGVPLGLVAGLYTYTDASAGQTLDLPAGLPELVTIDQMPLSTDGMTITLPADQPVDISFVADRQTNTSYQIEMDEIIVTGATLTRTPVFIAKAVQPDVTIPASQFVAGHTYVLRAVCISGGYTNIAAGDLSSTALPISIGYFDSGVFTVAN